MAKKSKGLNRGGSLGQEAELEPSVDLEKGQPKAVDERDGEKQRGGIGREPNLDDKQRIQPTHQVD
jgi:hypothetical protein